MSRTRNTLSTGAFKRKHELDYWWDSPLVSRYVRRRTGPIDKSYLPPTPRGVSLAKSRYVRRWWHSQRFAVKLALRNGQEPEPSRTRGSVRYDMD